MDAPTLLDGLRTWQCAPAVAAELRRLYSGTLNRSLAARMLDVLPAGAAARSKLDELAPDIAASSWTTPALAFSYFALDSAGERELRELEAVTRSPAAPPVFAPAGAWPAYATSALGVFEADQARDGRDVRLAPHPGNEALIERCRGALDLLETTWPEMRHAVDVFVREVRFFSSDDVASRSASMTQAFGAVFLTADGLTRVEALEHLVHEATHFEMTTRMAVDKHFVPGEQLAASPFREQPRPLPRVLHACFVATRATHALDLAVPQLAADERDEANWRLGHMRSSLAAALESLAEAPWSAVGAALYARMQERFDVDRVVVPD